MTKVLTSFLLLCLAASLVAWAVLLLHERGLHPLRDAVKFVRRLSWGGRLAVLPLFFALLVFGSTKDSGELIVDSGEWIVDSGELIVDSGLNSSSYTSHSFCTSYTDSVMSEALTDFQLSTIHSPLSTGSTDLANSQLSTLNYQLTNAVVCEDWQRFGAYEDWIYIGPGEWSFRYGSNFVEKITVFSSGKLGFASSGGISLIGIPVSIVPEANWWKTERESRFWHEETASNTLVLTWQNALLNREPSAPVSIQAELFPSGEAEFRYGFSSLPDMSVLSNAAVSAWGEGWSETLDLATGATVSVAMSAPPLPAAETADEVFMRIEGGNTNAYFDAEVMVGKGPSLIKVGCDGSSTLGEYTFVAYPGVTNRLPMLIGPKYTVESEAAFTHFAVGKSEVSVSNISDRIVEVQWPVEISFEEGYAVSGKVFTITVEPSFLGGTVTWGVDSGELIVDSGEWIVES